MSGFTPPDQKGPDAESPDDTPTVDAEPPDDPQHTPDNAQPDESDPTHPPYERLLGQLASKARILRQEIERDELRPETRRRALRHARELQAELELLERVLDTNTTLDTAAFEDEISKIVRHSPGQTVVLGPDPVAFERRRGG